MSAQPAALSRSRARLVLATLFLGTFVMGSSELLVVGVLNLIAADLLPAVDEAVASSRTWTGTAAP